MSSYWPVNDCSVPRVHNVYVHAYSVGMFRNARRLTHGRGSLFFRALTGTHKKELTLPEFALDGEDL